jgi:hypothetical protein
MIKIYIILLLILFFIQKKRINIYIKIRNIKYQDSKSIFKRFLKGELHIYKYSFLKKGDFENDKAVKTYNILLVIEYLLFITAFTIILIHMFKTKIEIPASADVPSVPE